MTQDDYRDLGLEVVHALNLLGLFGVPCICSTSSTQSPTHTRLLHPERRY